jgi:hypothetical protein
MFNLDIMTRFEKEGREKGKIDKFLFSCLKRKKKKVLE